jgi:hypothetical protein
MVGFRGPVQVATVPTPIAPGVALWYLGQALPPGTSRAAALIVAAQAAVETAEFGSPSGHGFANWNFGNITPSATQIAHGIAWMTQNVPNMQYIAYPSAASGAASFVRFLQTRGLLTAALTGSIAAYEAALVAACYLGCVGNVDPSTGKTITQASYDTYASGISSYVSKLGAVTPTPPPLVPPTSNPGTTLLEVGGAIAAASSLWYAGEKLLRLSW